MSGWSIGNRDARIVAIQSSSSRNRHSSRSARGESAIASTTCTWPDDEPSSQLIVRRYSA